MPETRTRMLVIGLGGIGTQVAHELDQRLSWRYAREGQQHRPPVRFLGYDSHAEMLLKLGLPGSGLEVSPSELSAMRRDSRSWDPRINLSKWVDETLLGQTTNQAFVEGVGGVRMYGRLAFLANAHWSMMCEQLVSNINYLMGERAPDQQTPVRIYVIASAAGGTGSGCFIDMGYLLQHLIDEKGWSPDELHAVGVALVPRPIVPHPRFRRNAAASLTELDECCDPSFTYRVRHQKGVHITTPDFESSERPYDYCLAVSPEGHDGDTEEARLDSLCHRLAELLYADAHGQLGEAWGARKNQATRFGLVDSYGYHYYLATLGSCRIEFPAEVCLRACVASTVGELAARLTREDESTSHPPANDVAEACRELGMIHQLQGATDAASDSAFQALVRVPDQRPSLLSTLKELVDSLLDKPSTSLSSVGTQIDAAFLPASGIGTSQALVTSVVDSNKRAVLSPEGPISRFVSRCVSVALDPQKGVAQASALATRIREAAQAEIAVIDAQREEAVTWATHVRDEQTALRLVEEDPLNPLRGWAARHVRRTFRSKAYEYCNRKLEAAVLPVKRDLYHSLTEEKGVCAALLRRLNWLGRYLDRVQSANKGPEGIYEEALRLTGGPFILMDEPLVAEKVRVVLGDADPGSSSRLAALRSLTAEGSGNLDRLRQDLRRPEWENPRSPFASGFPQDERGQPDFSYLEALVADAESRFESAGPNGVPLIGDVDVVSLLSEKTSSEPGGVNAALEEAVKRSAEWLRMNQDGVYRDTGTTGDQPISWWGFHAYCDPTRSATQHHAWFQEALGQAATRVKRALNLDIVFEQKPIADERLILLLRDTVGFPSRLISGYNPEERRELLDQSFAYSRRGIELPPRQDEKDEAGGLIVGGVVCEFLKPFPAQGVLRYDFIAGAEHTDDLASIELPNDYTRAVRLLARRERWRGALGAAFEERVNAQGPAEFNELIRRKTAALRPSQPSEAVTGGWGVLRLNDQEAWEQIVNFVGPYRGLGLKTPETNRYVRNMERLREGDTLSFTPGGNAPVMKAPRAGGYCLRCGSLACVGDNEPPVQCTNPKCGVPFLTKGRDKPV